LPDSLTLRIAKNLTREVAYRGFRGISVPSFTPVAKTSDKGRVSVSIIESNVLGALFYSIVSFSAGITLLAASEVGASVTDVFSISLTVLVSFAFAISLIQVASFTSTFIREGMIDLLRLLPLTDSQILKTYLAALILYWGGLSLTFIFIPFLIISTLTVVWGTLPGMYLLLGLFAVAAVFAFSYSLGIALGSYSYAVRRRASLRLMSTVAWLLSFMMMFILYRVSSIMPEAAKSLEPVLRTWGVLVPFVGPLFSVANLVPMFCSIGESVLLTLAAYILARRRISKVFLGGIEYSIAAGAGPMRKVVVSEVRFRIRGLIGAMIYKDIKLLSREPRRLANILFLVLLPIIMAVPLGSSPLITEHVTYLVLASLLGAFSGLASDYIFYAEGSGALVLYYLPVKKYDVALAKGLACSLITLPISVAIACGLTLYFTGDLMLAAIATVVMVMLNLGFSFINSAITMSMLPEAPSEWSEYSFKTSMGTRFVRSVVKFVVAMVGVGVPLVIVLLTLLMKVSSAMAELLLAAYAVASLLAGLVLLRVATGFKPL